MHINRREFCKNAAVGLGALGVAAPARSADILVRPFSHNGPGGQECPRSLRLGLVTYNLAADWDLPTIIKNCEAAKFEGVELRTTHAHKVEVNLSAAERREVKARFAGSAVQLMGLGSTFDFHTPDQTKLRRDIAAAKDYLLLARDVGAAGVKVRPNGLPKEVPVEKTLAQIGRALAELGNFARDHGLVVRLEVHGPGTAFPPHIKTILDTANHPSVGACWNSNPTDLDGEGWDHNFELLKKRIIEVHMGDLFNEEYPFRKLLTRLNEMHYTGFCLAEIPPSPDPVRVMKYYRALWLAYQGG